MDPTEEENNIYLGLVLILFVKGFRDRKICNFVIFSDLHTSHCYANLFISLKDIVLYVMNLLLSIPELKAE